MRGFALCLSLLLAFSASAYSLDEALCRKASLPVARMDSSEKLCRSFAQALTRVPAEMTHEARALLTPENLALMGTLTAAWAGSQGVPIVGQTVDAALLALGTTLLITETGALVDCMWRYVNLATAARSRAELDEASTYLARALSMVGINVVAFILTKKAVSKAPGGPPSPPREFALPRGSRVTAKVLDRASPSVSAPAVLVAGGSGNSREPPAQGRRPVKTLDPATFEKWVRKARRRLPRETPEKALAFQKKHAGPEELLVEGGGEKVWADGARASDAHLLDTKHVDKPGASPFIEGSACDEDIRQIIRTQEANQFSRYAAVISDPTNPAVGLEVIVNDSRALPFFEGLLAEFGIPGRVVVKSE